MNNSNRKPILVTGSHRSGSTWTGRMIALSPSVAYIHEPFNLHHRPGICKAQFDYQFFYICNENELHYLNHLKDCLNFKYHFIEELKIIKSIKDIVRSILDYSRFTEYRILKKRPLIKDPIAVFSAEWLANRFNMDVVVLIRHPAAFAGSLKEIKWSHPFEHFLQQPLLMKNHLHEYKAEIEEFSKNKKSIIDQAILLWNLIHHIILYYRNNNPDWIFLRHEDLSKQPLQQFKNLYNKLNLNFTASIENEIRAFSFPMNLNGFKTNIKSKIKGWKRKLAYDHADQRKRNSLPNIWSWQQRLTSDDIEKIKLKTFKIAKNFYTEEDWIESTNQSSSEGEL